jgi:hypothetical protein
MDGRMRIFKRKWFRVLSIVILTIAVTVIWCLHFLAEFVARKNLHLSQSLLSNAEIYYREYDRYPDSIDTLLAWVRKKHPDSGLSPENPWGHRFIWHTSHDGQEVYFYDLGRDGKIGPSPNRIQYECREREDIEEHKGEDVDRDWEVVLIGCDEEAKRRIRVGSEQVRCQKDKTTRLDRNEVIRIFREAKKINDSFLNTIAQKNPKETKELEERINNHHWKQLLPAIDDCVCLILENKDSGLVVELFEIIPQQNNRTNESFSLILLDIFYSDHELFETSFDKLKSSDEDKRFILGCLAEGWKGVSHKKNIPNDKRVAFDSFIKKHLSDQFLKR